MNWQEKVLNISSVLPIGAKEVYCRLSSQASVKLRSQESKQLRLQAALSQSVRPAAALQLATLPP